MFSVCSIWSGSPGGATAQSAVSSIFSDPDSFIQLTVSELPVSGQSPVTQVSVTSVPDSAAQVYCYEQRCSVSVLFLLCASSCTSHIVRAQLTPTGALTVPLSVWSPVWVASSLQCLATRSDKDRLWLYCQVPGSVAPG